MSWLNALSIIIAGNSRQGTKTATLIVESGYSTEWLNDGTKVRQQPPLTVVRKTSSADQSVSPDTVFFAWEHCKG